jgi:hypothetical protein
MYFEKAYIVKVREAMEYVDSKEDPVAPIVRNIDTT